MHQLQVLVRAQRPHRLNGAVTDAAAAVAGHAGRLVDHQQLGIFKNDGLLHPLQEAGGRRRIFSDLIEIDGRDANLLAALKLAVGLGATAIHPHLATSDQFVDQAAGRTLELAQQEVVQALSRPVFGNLDHAHAGLGGGRGVALVGVSHQPIYSATLGPRYKGLISLEVGQGQKPRSLRIRHSARPPPPGRPC
ncbi:hypothetical protein D3C71_1510390 [compost metagenome]